MPMPMSLPGMDLTALQNGIAAALLIQWYCRVVQKFYAIDMYGQTARIAAHGSLRISSRSWHCGRAAEARRAVDDPEPR